jgi:hypothetical protein
MAKLKVNKEMAKQERQWQVEDAMRTLKRAEEIRQDSKLMGEVKKSMESLNKMLMSGAMKPAAPKVMKPVTKKIMKKK